MSDLMVKIDAGSTKEKSSVHATGSLRHVITDKERATFGILDDDLRRKVGAYMGKEPRDVFVRSPTPWDDLYKRYGWDEVETVLVPIETEILSVDTVPIMITKLEFKNELSHKATFFGKLSKEVATTVETSWSHSYALSLNQEIHYGLGFLGTGAGGSTSFGFEAVCGHNKVESKATTFGTEAGISVELEPGEEVVAELNANSGKMKVRITYEARITGQTAINYPHKFEGHHFYGLWIRCVVDDSDGVKVSEDIEIGYYDEARVTLKDRVGKTLRSERVPMFFR